MSRASFWMNSERVRSSSPSWAPALLLEVELQLPGLAQLLDVGRAGAVERGAARGQLVDLGAEAGQPRLEVGALPLHLGERAAAGRGPAVGLAGVGAGRLRLGGERDLLRGHVAQRGLQLGEAGLVGAGEAGQLVALPQERVPLGRERVGLDLERLDLGGLAAGALGDLVELALGGLGGDGRHPLLALQLVLPVGELLQRELALGQERPVGLQRQVDLGQARGDLGLVGAGRRVALLGLPAPHRQLEPAGGAHVQLELADLRPSAPGTSRPCGPAG